MVRKIPPISKPDTGPKPTDTGKEKPEANDDEPSPLTGGLFAAISGLWFHHTDTEDDARATAYALWKSGGVSDTERDHLMTYLAARNRTTPQTEREEFDKLAAQDGGDG